MGHFKKYCSEINGNSTKIVSKDYEDAGALVVSCWKDEEGVVSHLMSDTL